MPTHRLCQVSPRQHGVLHSTWGRQPMPTHWLYQVSPGQYGVLHSTRGRQAMPTHRLCQVSSWQHKVLRTTRGSQAMLAQRLHRFSVIEQSCKTLASCVPHWGGKQFQNAHRCVIIHIRPYCKQPFWCVCTIMNSYDDAAATSAVHNMNIPMVCLVAGTLSIYTIYSIQGV